MKRKVSIGHTGTVGLACFVMFGCNNGINDNAREFINAKGTTVG